MPFLKSTFSLLIIIPYLILDNSELSEFPEKHYYVEGDQTYMEKKMGKKDRNSKPKEKQKVKIQLYEEPIIQDLKEEFNLSSTVIDASILIFRLFVGLGKGLTKSQRKSFAATSLWYAKKVIDGEKLSKKKLADTLNISPRTLTRRFKDLEDDEDSKIVLDYIKQEIKEWSNKRDKKLEKLL